MWWLQLIWGPSYFSCNSLAFTYTLSSFSRSQPWSLSLGEFHGQRSLVGYNPWGHKESDTTEWLTHTLYLDWCYYLSNILYICGISLSIFLGESNCSQEGTKYKNWISQMVILTFQFKVTKAYSQLNYILKDINFLLKSSLIIKFF